MTPDQFAEKIKAKYPEYKDLDNADLTRRVLNKYPQYESQVRMPETKSLGMFTGTEERLADVGQSTAETIKANIEGTGEFADQSSLRRGVQATAAGFTAVPRGALAMAPKSIRQGAEKVGEILSKGFGKVTDTIAETPLFKEIGELEAQGHISPEKTPGLYQLEDALAIASAGGEIAGTITGARGLATDLPRTAASAQKLIQSTFKQTDDGIQPTTQTFVETARLADPEQYTQAKTKLTDTYMDSIVNTETARKKLEAIALQEGIEPRQVVENFVESGGFANGVNDSGKVTFFKTREDFRDRKQVLGKTISDYMKTQTELTNIDDLRASIRADIENHGDLFTSERAMEEANKLLDSIEARYGKNLTPSQLHEMRVEANTKYPREAKNHEIGAYTAIGNATRDRIDEIVGDKTIREANAAWGNLARQERVINILDGQKVDVGLLNDSIGSYIGASAVGTAGFVTGSGSLVIAGLASTVGAKTFANWVRRRRINDPEVQKVLDVLREDQAIANKLIEEIRKVDAEAARRIEEGLLLPAAGETSAPIQIPPKDPTLPGLER